MFKKLRTVTIKYTSTSELNVILKHKNYDCETFFFPYLQLINTNTQRSQRRVAIGQALNSKLKFHTCHSSDEHFH